MAIVLEAEAAAWVNGLIRKHGAPQALVVRARIGLAAASGLTNKQVAARVGVCAAGRQLAKSFAERRPLR